MKTAIATFFTMAGILGLCPAYAGGGGAGVDSRVAFERLKGLSGDWQGRTADNNQPVSINYKATSNGSAVLETLFPGTEHEMLTVYHLDSGKLVLTHYCSAGNQPRMALTKQSTPEQLVFDFTGGANVKPGKDGHMHAMRMRFEPDGRVTAEWDFFKDGKKAETKKFTFSRKATS